MGCSKNLVDSEVLMRQLEANGYKCVHDSQNPSGEIAIINTCGFIGDAKEESINVILEFAERKKKGLLDKLFVMGCLSQRYQMELEQEIPEVDKYYGKFDFFKILEDLGKTEISLCHPRRHLTTPGHFAYLKISEGCDRRCAFCAIPIITGKHVSRSQESILEEVRELVALGVKEFQVIAQELTYYGVDVDGKQHIAELIEAISDVPGVKWIRLHYAYPAHFPFELLRVMRERANVCNYLDIALQHISDHLLSSMHRHVTKAETYELIQRIRDEAEEEGTYSALHYEDDVPEEVKKQRLGKLMALQQVISMEIESHKVGQVFPVIIDRKEGGYYVGRTEYSSPEVDPEVLIDANDRLLRKGRFYNVRITDSTEFDLYGKVL